MIQLAPHIRLWVAVEPADFRCGIDGLCRICRHVLKIDPFSGAVFVFRNRRQTSIKLISYDGQGYWLAQKRLSAGKFPHWPKSGQSTHIELFAHQLQLLLVGGDPGQATAAPEWRPIVKRETPIRKK